MKQIGSDLNCARMTKDVHLCGLETSLKNTQTNIQNYAIHAIQPYIYIFIFGYMSPMYSQDDSFLISV